MHVLRHRSPPLTGWQWIKARIPSAGRRTPFARGGVIVTPGASGGPTRLCARFSPAEGRHLADEVVRSGISAGGRADSSVASAAQLLLVGRLRSWVLVAAASRVGEGRRRRSPRPIRVQSSGTSVQSGVVLDGPQGSADGAYRRQRSRRRCAQPGCASADRRPANPHRPRTVSRGAACRGPGTPSGQAGWSKRSTKCIHATMPFG